LLDGGRRLHVNVFGIGERQHEALQRRRRDFEAFVACLAEERLPASVNHLFSALTGARDLADLRRPLGRLGLVEALNGAMPEAHNEQARLVGREAGMAPVGGSDGPRPRGERRGVAGRARAPLALGRARGGARGAPDRDGRLADPSPIVGSARVLVVVQSQMASPGRVQIEELSSPLMATSARHPPPAAVVPCRFRRSPSGSLSTRMSAGSV
jgi:hypothetical protein